MKITITQPLEADSAADPFDVRQMKKILNRLGYYAPYEKTGIIGIPDADMFAALKNFQADNNLAATGSVRPDDDTVAALNAAASREKEGTYIWRTVSDDKVRAAHAALNGTVRSWSDSPDPGEDYNCRCWAEEANISECEQLNIEWKNAQLELESTLKKLYEQDEKAKKIRVELDLEWENLKEEIRKSGLDISMALVPGLDGKLPILSAIVETVKNAAAIFQAYKKYSDLFEKLSEVINLQKYFEARVSELHSKINYLLDRMKNLSCVF